MRVLMAAMLLLGSFAAHAVPLQARDFNADGVVDGYYDSGSNLTWLADANYARTIGFTGSSPFVDGELAIDEAKAWLTTLNVNGVTGWRLPRTMPGVPPGVDPDFLEQQLQSGGYVRFQPTPEYSELAYLYYTTLGNSMGPRQNDGPFFNISSLYLTDLYAPFLFDTGEQFVAAEMFPLHAWAVRDGDVLPVPEPATNALLMIGIAGLAVVCRRRKQ